MKLPPKETIAKAIASAVVAVLAVLKMFGIELGNITETEIYTAVLPFVTIGVWVYGFYKNNDFTKEAIEGTKYMRAMKMHRKAGDEIIEGGDGDVAEC